MPSSTTSGSSVHPSTTASIDDVLGATELTPDTARDTIGAVVKDRDDLDLVNADLARITSGA